MEMLNVNQDGQALNATISNAQQTVQIMENVWKAFVSVKTTGQEKRVK